MNYVVTIPAINFLFLVGDLPGESLPRLKGPEDWKIEEGGWVEVEPNLGEWPYGTKAPQWTVCQSRRDVKHYKVFNRPDGIPRDEFEVTGLNWGGPYTRSGWDHFARGELADLLKLHDLPDNDPPGAMEEAMRHIRGARQR